MLGELPELLGISSREEFIAGLLAKSIREYGCSGESTKSLLSEVSMILPAYKTAILSAYRCAISKS